MNRKSPTDERGVVLRADGSSQIGLGHLMRTLALGEALVAQGWSVTLASAELPPAVAERASRHAIHTHPIAVGPGGGHDAQEVVNLGSAVVVVDGYEFESSFFETLDAGACRYAVIDDNVETQATAPALVVNQNPHAVEAMYHHLRGHPQLLLGLDYALLRAEVQAARVDRDHTRAGKQVFLSMGGGDPLRLTGPLVTGLQRLGASVRVVISPLHPDRPQLEELVDECSTSSIVAPEDFVGALAQSDLAVVAAGSTMWEAAHLGVPILGLVVADNQAEPSAAADRLGFVRRVDCRTTTPPDAVVAAADRLLGDQARLASMSLLGRRIVTGGGAARVADQLTNLAAEGAVRP